MGGRDSSSHRQTERNDKRTALRIERYLGKRDLKATWEQAPEELQIKEHDYLLKLNKTVRQEKNYLDHRASPQADI